MKTKQIIMFSLIVLCCVCWSGNTFAADYDPTAERAQLELIKQGYDPGTPDGKIGKKTTDAIKKYQYDQKLPETGELDEKTLKGLKIAPPK
ncbi:MAG: peptidoglycan-binding protein, partial [Desulfuromonadales bacterium]|nr:peptidoglycan-binding protein [Desulfuromonadales bacterium]